jgi:serine/threonine-protein kinase RsbW
VNVADAQLLLPAESAYVAVLRMTTAGLAARLDFTIDDIEDLRMAVGEACGLVLDGAAADGKLSCSYHLDDGRIAVTVAADHGEASPPDRDSFGWQVLTALVEDLQSQAHDGRREISFAVSSATA